MQLGVPPNNFNRLPMLGELTVVGLNELSNLMIDPEGL